jgi:hypothetical protein
MDPLALQRHHHTALAALSFFLSALSIDHAPLRGLKMAKAVKPYEAVMKSSFDFSHSEARLTCIAVRTKATRTVAAAKQARLSPE